MTDAGNRPCLALAAGTNQVYGDWTPHLELPAALAAVELGLVEGPVLDDVDYVTDYSGPSPQGGATRVYRGLQDALEPRALAAWRHRLVALLEGLLDEGEAWFLFLRGALDANSPTPEERCTGRFEVDGDCGTWTVFAVAPGELDAYAPLFGACDRVAGLAAPDHAFRTVLAGLTLAEPLPTGQRYRFGWPFAPQDASGLERALGRGRLFFEEIDNGTRLRLVTRRTDTGGLHRRLAQAIAAGG